MLIPSGDDGVDQNRTPGLAFSYIKTLHVSVFLCHSVDASGKCTCGNPACPKPGKHPRTPGGVADATVDPAEVDRLLREHPQSNIAIATGTRSACIVLDVDPRHEGMDSLRTLSERLGLPESYWVITGGGGHHLYFAIEPGLVVPSRSRVIGFPGLDVVAENGYVIAPPSRHRSGRLYKWYFGSFTENDRWRLAPQWLIEMARTGVAPDLSASQREVEFKHLYSTEGADDVF